METSALSGAVVGFTSVIWACDKVVKNKRNCPGAIKITLSKPLKEIADT